MTRPPNTMGQEANFVGSAPMGFNQYLESPVDTEPSLEVYAWSGQILTFFTDSISRGIVDHIHYKVTTDGAIPTPAELADADVWASEGLVINLPEASGVAVHMTAHDRFHRTMESSQDVFTFEEFWIDLTPPSGQVFVNGGAPVTLDQTVQVHAVGMDELSGVAQMYIDGDVKGVNVKNWIDYEEYTDIELSDEEGKHAVMVRFRDHAGNVSDYFWNTIMYPLVRYYFKKASNMNRQMNLDSNVFIIETNDMRITGNEMKESEEHGRFGSN